jgi:hypothetical protein
LSFQTLFSDTPEQKVKENKEECTALGKHAEELTSKLLIHLESRNDLDAMKPVIDSFAKCVVYSLNRLRSSLHRRTLKGIKEFTDRQVKRNYLKGLIRKDSDLNEIKEWHTVLKRAYDCFQVTTLPTILDAGQSLTELSTDRCCPQHSGRGHYYQG